MRLHFTVPEIPGITETLCISLIQLGKSAFGDLGSSHGSSQGQARISGLGSGLRFVKHLRSSEKFVEFIREPEWNNVPSLVIIEILAYVCQKFAPGGSSKFSMRPPHSESESNEPTSRQAVQNAVLAETCQKDEKKTASTLPSAKSFRLDSLSGNNLRDWAHADCTWLR